MNPCVITLRTSEIHLFYNLLFFYWHFLEILWFYIFLVFYKYYLSFFFSLLVLRKLENEIIILFGSQQSFREKKSQKLLVFLNLSFFSHFLQNLQLPQLSKSQMSLGSYFSFTVSFPSGIRIEIISLKKSFCGLLAQRLKGNWLGSYLSFISYSLIRGLLLTNEFFLLLQHLWVMSYLLDK